MALARILAMVLSLMLLLGFAVSETAGRKMLSPPAAVVPKVVSAAPKSFSNRPYGATTALQSNTADKINKAASDGRVLLDAKPSGHMIPKLVAATPKGAETTHKATVAQAGTSAAIHNAIDNANKKAGGH